MPPVAGAYAYGDDDLGIWHLGIDLPDHLGALGVHPAGDQQDVRMKGIASVDDAEAFDVIFGGWCMPAPRYHSRCQLLAS